MPGEEAWKGSAVRRLKGYVAPSNYYKSMCQKKKKKTNKQKKNKSINNHTLPTISLATSWVANYKK